MTLLNFRKNSKPKAFRWAIIGLGHAGTIHMHAIHQMKHDLIGFSTSDQKILNGDASHLKFNIGDIPGPQFEVTNMLTVQNWRNLLEEPSIEGFIVCTPTITHAEIAMEVAKSGKHCFLEKPIALTLTDARRIKKAFQKSKGKLVVGHVLPSFPEYEYLRDVILRVGVGNVHKLVMRRYVPVSRVDDKADTVGRGGFALDLGAHDFELVCSLNITPRNMCTTGYGEEYGLPQYLETKLRAKETIGEFQFSVGADPQLRGDFHHSYHLLFGDGQELVFDGKAVTRNGLVLQMSSKTVPRIFGDELDIAVRYFRDEGDGSFLQTKYAYNALRVFTAAAKSGKSGNYEALEQ